MKRAALSFVLACLACGSKHAGNEPFDAGQRPAPSPMTAAPGDAGSGCQSGTYRCDGSTLQACTRGSWSDAQSCSSAALCQSGLPNQRCDVASCESGQTRCTGATAERCNRTRDGWDEVEHCATPDLCDAAAGRCN